jgi:P pilus assembly chaperone PapD
VRYFILIVAVVLVCGGNVFAAIRVAPMEITFDPIAGNNSQNLTVYNEGGDTAYVQTTPSLVENPGAPQPIYKTIKDPRELGLLISPQKFAIPAHQSQFVRIVVIKQCPSQEQIYRIVVSPVLGDLVLATTTSKSKQKLGLKLIIAYGVRLKVLPCQPIINVVFHRTGNTAELINNGNVSVDLSQGKQCLNAKHCVIFSDKTLHPGDKWNFKVPYDKEVTFQEQYMDVVKKIVSN